MASFNINDDSNYYALIEHLKKQNYSKALSLYALLVEDYPDSFFSANSSNLVKDHKVHLRNMASLSRKKLYDSIVSDFAFSPRLTKALSFMVGILPKEFQHPQQQPSFFYVPDLTAKPFYQVTEIPGLQACVKLLRELITQSNYGSQELPDSYVDVMGNSPKSKAWNDLKDKNWGSEHLIKGGDIVNKTFSDILENVLKTDAIANCPPHAPEVFISRLKPSAFIPPHFGLSNIKLTVHLPIKVNELCSLSVGDETLRWNGEQDIIIFDDSFRHSAENAGNEARTVVIFDVWHPDLNKKERNALSLFMDRYQRWNCEFGKLATLDQDL